MVFEAALRHMRRGETALARGSHDEATAALEKAVEIVCALDGTLKQDAAPELCEQLQQIYRFVVGRLTLALVNRDGRPVGEAVRAFGPVAEAFGQAAAQAPGAAARP
jgi:flagellin-specific chaperone FliS